MSNGTNSGFNFKKPTNKDLLEGGEGLQGTIEPNEIPQARTPRASSSNYQMNSLFDNDTSEVSKSIIEVANLILSNKTITGQANAVSISGSDIFKGVNINMTSKDNITYSQAIIIDERPLKSVTELQQEGKQNGSVIFASALLNANNAKFLKEFNSYQKGAVVMDPLIVISQDVTAEDVKELVKTVFKRMEAKPFQNVEASLDYDKSKPMSGATIYDGQNVNIMVTHKDTATTLEDLIIGSANTLLDVKTRVEPSIGLKKRIRDNQQQDVHAVRPLIFIKDYNKPKTFASFNLEYGLIAIVAATVMSKRDKTIMSLLPSSKYRTNIGALNAIFKVHPDKTGQYPVMPLNDPKASMDIKVGFIDDLCTPAGIGLDVAYRATASPYSAFATLVDTTASNEAKQAAGATISQAIKNVTGHEFGGEIIERSFQYPTGLIVDKNGTKRDISTIDAIWLAGNGEMELASRWIISDTVSTSLSDKIAILTELAQKHEDLDIRIKSAGVKIILSVDFIQALVTSAGISIDTGMPDLQLPQQQSTFGNISNLGVTTGFDTAGINFTGNNGSGLKFVF